MENKNEQAKFIDEGTYLANYMNHFFVHCPKCDKQAIINDKKELYCSHCNYIQKSKKVTFNLEVKAFCPNCGEKIEKQILEIKDKKDRINIKCSNCKSTQSYKPKYIENTQMFDVRNKISDPCYNLPLWLQGEFKKNTFWAYNYDHLTYIEKYIKAKLRVRSGKTYTSMVEKLPQWIKSKKNRDALLSLVDKLKKK